MRYFDNERPEFAPYGFTCELWKPAPMARPDQHDEIEINFLMQGTLTYLIGGSRITVEPRTLTMFWAAVPHQIIEHANVTCYYVITIPFEWFLQWGIPESFRTKLILGEVLSSDNVFTSVDDASLFEQWHRDLSEHPDELTDIVLLELKARLLRLALSPRQRRADRAGRNPGQPERGAANLEKAERMACYIARNFKARLRVSDIAETVGLHPDYAATLFRKTFGTTLISLITRHRIAEAQRLLIMTADPIVDIAYDSGFESLSRFNRAFKETTGITPRAYRRDR